ncbi:MAG TPA: thiolase family protein, partial [Gaiellaceae bacterium]
MSAKAAIVGLGITEMGKVYGRTAVDFAAEAVALALDDAGLEKSELDGLLVNANARFDNIGPRLQMSLGLEDMTFVNVMNSFGSTAGMMLEYATYAVSSGRATAVACLFADAPLQEKVSSSAAYAGNRLKGAVGMAGLRTAHGLFGANPSYALGARRHMHEFGTTQDQLGTIAIGQRAWALKNPRAQMKKPMTLEDYHASRWIVEPFHLFDCGLVSNGSVAVIVTSAERARTLKQPPVFLRGFGQIAPGDNQFRGRDPLIDTGAKVSGEQALRQAGIELADVDFLELYDCYTYTVLCTIEDYGFCEKGEGGPFTEDGKLGPGGSLPTNTGGGQLSSFYMWGFTPVSEAVIQIRGEGGERQLERNDHALV